MNCPTCGQAFKPFTSWRMTPMNPLACGQCQTRVVRDGRLQPLLIAVGGIIAYGFALEFMPLSGVGKIMVLGIVLAVAMRIDERTLTLKVFAPPPAGSDTR